jgi:hypothetical protein
VRGEWTADAVSILKEVVAIYDSGYKPLIIPDKQSVKRSMMPLPITTPLPFSEQTVSFPTYSKKGNKRTHILRASDELKSALPAQHLPSEVEQAVSRFTGDDITLNGIQTTMLKGALWGITVTGELVSLHSKKLINTENVITKSQKHSSVQLAFIAETVEGLSNQDGIQLKQLAAASGTELAVMVSRDKTVRNPQVRFKGSANALIMSSDRAPQIINAYGPAAQPRTVTVSDLQLYVVGILTWDGTIAGGPSTGRATSLEFDSDSIAAAGMEMRLLTVGQLLAMYKAITGQISIYSDLKKTQLTYKRVVCMQCDSDNDENE